MRILLTNDDGINSPGLRAMRECLAEDHDVWTVCPAEEQSATSHSMTLRDAVRVRCIDERTYICWGTPVDCMLLAGNGLIAEEPELVISGINNGANVGSDIIFSGTAGAARQAAILGYPAIAVSIASAHPPFHFDTACGFVARNAELLVALWRRDHFVNINVPNVGNGGVRAALARPAVSEYEHKLEHFTAPDGEDYYFYKGASRPDSGQPDTDMDVLSRGLIAVSPVCLFHDLSPHASHYDSNLFA